MQSSVQRIDVDQLITGFLANERRAIYLLIKYLENNKLTEKEREQLISRTSAELAKKPINAKAYTLHGMLHHLGIDRPINFGAAMQWYRQGIEGGDTTAMNNLAFMYVRGEGCVKDEAGAIKLIRQAVELGDAVGITNLAWMRQYGKGCVADKAEAISLYRQAVELDNAIAMNNLACMYKRGEGCKINHEKAAYLFRKSYLHGFSDALKSLDFSHQSKIEDYTRYQAMMAAEQSDIYLRIRQSVVNAPSSWIDYLSNDNLISTQDKKEYLHYLLSQYQNIEDLFSKIRANPDKHTLPALTQIGEILWEEARRLHEENGLTETLRYLECIPPVSSHYRAALLWQADILFLAASNEASNRTEELIVRTKTLHKQILELDQKKMMVQWVIAKKEKVDNKTIEALVERLSVIDKLLNHERGLSLIKFQPNMDEVDHHFIIYMHRLSQLRKWQNEWLFKSGSSHPLCKEARVVFEIKDAIEEQLFTNDDQYLLNIQSKVTSLLENKKDWLEILLALKTTLEITPTGFGLFKDRYASQRKEWLEQIEACLAKPNLTVNEYK